MSTRKLRPVSYASVAGATEVARGTVVRNLARLTVLLLCLGGCATHSQKAASVREAFYAGDTGTARAALAELTSQRSHDRDVLLLDKAVVDLFLGQPRTAQRLLRDVRDRFDYFEQLDLREQILSIVTDDRSVAYPGEDYEKVLIRVMLAFADLVDDGDDVLAYALQAIQKQQELTETPLPGMSENLRKSYKQVAVAAYLYAVLREATYTDYDDAERWYTRVAAWAPQFSRVRLDLERARKGVFARPGNGVVYVFVFADRGPYKVESVEAPTTVSLAIASALITALGDYSVPPTIAPVKVPKVVAPPRRLDRVDVAVPGRATGHCETLTDINRMAVEQFEAIRPWVVARAVARRIVKKAAVVGVKDALGARDPVAQLALDLAGVAWEAAERADTRCWSLLPGRIDATRLELPAGEHPITLQAVGVDGRLGPPIRQSVQVAPGKATFVLGYFPSLRPVGRVLVSEPY